MKKRLQSKSGFSLVEAMLAGSMAILFTLSLLEGFIFAAKISRENSELLQADAYCFDAAWRRFNESFYSLPSSQVRSRFNVASNDLPVLSRPKWPAPIRYETVTNAADGYGKVICIDLEWGPEKKRKRMSDHHIVELYKSSIERGSL